MSNTQQNLNGSGRLRNLTVILALFAFLISLTSPAFVSEAARKTQNPTSQSDGLQGTVQATNEDVSGLHRTIFTTPQGHKIYVNTPDDMTAGDTLSGTVFAEPSGKTEAEREKGQAEIAGYVVEVNGQKVPATGEPFKLTLPVDFARNALAVTLYNNKGKELAKSEAPVSSDPPRSIPKDFQVPTYGQMGRIIQVRGPFNGDISGTDHIKLGGKELIQLAESPRQKAVLNTSPAAGMNELELSENGQILKGEFRNLSLRMSAEKYNLRRGETTTLHVEVSGLENLREDLPLRLANRSPNVMTMAGGDVQALTIHPADVKAGGAYEVQRTLTGVQVGAFAIDGTVIWKNEIAPANDAQALARPSGNETSNQVADATSAQLKIGNATCFCKILAKLPAADSYVEVARETKGGFDQLFQKEACRNYCRGIWDSDSSRQEYWAKLLPNACGDVSVKMEGALGTDSYQTLRGPVIVHLGGVLVTECICPAGQKLSKGNNYCLAMNGINLPGVPDQVLQGGFLVQSEVLYKINGPPCCQTYCKH